MVHEIHGIRLLITHNFWDHFNDISACHQLCFVSKHTHDWALQLNRLNICIMLTILAFVMISFFWQDLFFLKIFPIPGEHLFHYSFLFSRLLLHWKTCFKNPEIIEKVSLIMLALLIPFVLKSLADQYYRIKQADDKNSQKYTVIYASTHKRRYISFAGYNYASNVKTSFETSFSRETDRPLVVLFKFAKLRCKYLRMVWAI